MSSEFPSNSKEGRPTTPKPKGEKKIEKVVTGKVIQRKKSVGKKFMETFFPGLNQKSVFEFIWLDILVPGVKNTFLDMINQGSEKLVMGEVRSTSRRGRVGWNPIGHTAYHAMSRGVAESRTRADPRFAAIRSRTPHNFNDLVFETRPEAMEALDQLYKLIAEYEFASVAELYEMANLEFEFTDQKWGWTDIRGSDVVRVHDGYRLDLPPPEPID